MVAPEPKIERLVNRAEVRELMEDVLTQLTNKLDARTAQVTEEFVIEIMENLENDHNLVAVQEALKRATSKMLKLILNDSGVCKDSETAVIQMVTSEPMAQAIAKVLAKLDQIMAPLAK